MEKNKREKITKAKTQEEFVNTLDPEMDLRNINFATGENKYLTENNYDEL